MAVLAFNEYEFTVDWPNLLTEGKPISARENRLCSEASSYELYSCNLRVSFLIFFSFIFYFFLFTELHMFRSLLNQLESGDGFGGMEALNMKL
jgi:hypothetical protein